MQAMLGLTTILLPIGLAVVVAGLISWFGKHLTTSGGILALIVLNAVIYSCVYLALQLPEMILTFPLMLLVLIPWGFAFTNGASAFMQAVATQALIMTALSAGFYLAIRRRRGKSGEQCNRA